ncbi:MAG: tetratricopeptide repeat protein, partial [Anaerolineales bacterium]|nr:tetratricopeptide repeat protein [Anaerolineales bacterium]
MAGRRDIFEKALNAGHAAAWDGQWDQAIQAYQAAVGEFPDDGSALNALGMALLEKGRLKEALAVYQRAAGKIPGDPTAPEKCGEILERLGRPQEAGQAYLYVAELHMKRQDVAKAVTTLARSVKATPDNLGARSRLALALEKAGKQQAAALEFIEVARLFQKANDPAKANAALQRAVQLSPQLPEAREAFGRLKNAQPIQTSPRGVDLALEAPASSTSPLTPNPLGVFAEAAAAAQPVRKANALEQAREIALTLLAELLFDEDADTTKTASSVTALSRGTGALRNAQGQRAHAIMYLGQAINEQSLGSREAALNLYTNVLQAGLDHPLVHFMRGVLLL